MERLRWNPQGSDTPSDCAACRMKHAAVAAMTAAVLGRQERAAEAREFRSLVAALAREFERFEEATRSPTEPPRYGRLAEALARVAVALTEMEPWTVHRNCSCSRGPTVRKRSRRPEPARSR